MGCENFQNMAVFSKNNEYALDKRRDFSKAPSNQVTGQPELG